MSRDQQILPVMALWVDFCYCHYKKFEEITNRDQVFFSVIGGFPLLKGPLQRGVTVCRITKSIEVPKYLSAT